MQEMNFSEAIEIDPTQLDREWLQQPDLFLAVAEEEAACARDVAVMEEHLAQVEAELALDIRANPKDYDAPEGARGGVTDSICTALITLQPKYQGCKKALTEARYKYDRARAAARAFDHRRSALERLVALHGQNYFSSPKNPPELTPERAKEIRDSSRMRRRLLQRQAHKQQED